MVDFIASFVTVVIKKHQFSYSAVAMMACPTLALAVSDSVIFI